ncbi:MAG: TonB-dependent receptor, partial [Sphingomonadaceae bacterium]
VETLADFSAKVPNVSLQPVGAFQFASAFSIRGLGFADVESSAEPAVGVEVDGVYLARNVGALLDLFDIEGVQVLRGPQGTLYGRNTIGGVVSVRSARPDDEFGGKFQGTIGSYGRREARAMVKTPLNDSLGFKIAGLYKDYDGYIDNADGRSLPKERTRSVRGTLTFESGDFDSALIADYTKLKGDGPGFENASLPTMVLPVRGYPADQDGEPYTTYATDSNALMLETWGVTLEMNASLPIGTFTSISGYRKTNQSTDSDFDGEPVRFLQVDRREDHYQFSQEMRLAGDVGNLNYVVGGYFLAQEYNIGTHQYGTLFGTPDAGSTLYSSQYNDSVAVFGQLDYEIFPYFTISAGGRWGHEYKRFTIQPLFYTAPETFNASFNKFTPKLGINYKPSNDLMFYAQYSVGYRSGGFNGRASNFTVVGPYSPETVKNYEAGFKSQFLDRKATLNATIFQMDYEDQQLSVQESMGNINQTLVRNAASSRYKGAEIELGLRPGGGFTINGSLGYLDAKFNDFIANLGDGLGTIDRSALPIAFAPKWSGGITANWTGYVGPGELSAQTSMVHSSSQYTTFTAVNGYSDLTLRKANTKFDASLSYKLDNGLRFAVWGKNLTDKVVMNNTFTVGNLMAPRVYQPPREFGFDVGYEF